MTVIEHFIIFCHSKSRKKLCHFLIVALKLCVSCLFAFLHFLIKALSGIFLCLNESRA